MSVHTALRPVQTSQTEKETLNRFESLAIISIVIKLALSLSFHETKMSLSRNTMKGQHMISCPDFMIFMLVLIPQNMTPVPLLHP